MKYDIHTRSNNHGEYVNKHNLDLLIILHCLRKIQHSNNSDTIFEWYVAIYVSNNRHSKGHMLNKEWIKC